MIVKALKPKGGTYTQIIEIDAPCRFYWVGNEFDGIEFGPFREELEPWEEEMLFDCLDAIAPSIGVG